MDWTPCAIEKPCNYHVKYGNSDKKYCNILNSDKGNPPFYGVCPFWKPKKKP